MYMDDTDAKQILHLLNADPEVAFIAAVGEKRWQAVKNLESISDGRYCIWHIPSGPLPRIGGSGNADSPVSDPWAGWTEIRSGANTKLPWIGAGVPGVIRWNVRTHSRQNDGIGLSSFEWIGNYFKVIGRPANPAIDRWWKRLQNRIKNLKAIRIPRSGPIDDGRAEIWALPSAFEKIRNGTARDVNPI